MAEENDITLVACTRQRRQKCSYLPNEDSIQLNTPGRNFQEGTISLCYVFQSEAKVLIAMLISNPCLSWRFGYRCRFS